MLIAAPNLTIGRAPGVDPGSGGAPQDEARVGGGGSEVARVVHRLGASTRLISLIPEGDVTSVVDALGREGVVVEWVQCGRRAALSATTLRGRSRSGIDHDPHPGVVGREWDAFVRLVSNRLCPGEVLLCSGSLPSGAPTEGFVHLARSARQAGSRCVIDVGGGVLREVIEAGEGIIVSSLAEAEALLGGSGSEAARGNGDRVERAQRVVGGLLRGGAWSVVVTAGGIGAAYGEQGPRGRRGWVAAPTIAPRSPVGAADAFVAGLALRLQHDASLDGAVAYAVAIATAYVERRNAGRVGSASLPLRSRPA